MSDDTPTIAPIRGTPTCPKCSRDLVGVVENRANGKVQITLTCARHGSIPQGWRTKFLDNVRAQRWAARQAAQQAQQRRR